jgi:hypothetical protein
MEQPTSNNPSAQEAGWFSFVYVSNLSVLLNIPSVHTKGNLILL